MVVRIIKLVGSVILVLMSLFSGAQTFHQFDSIELLSTKKSLIKVDNPVSSILITAESIDNLDIELNTEGTIYALRDNIDVHGKRPSAFIIFNYPINEFTLSSPSSINLKYDLFYAPKIQINPGNSKNKKLDCEKPSTVSYTTWRAGLPEPKKGRTATLVKHCIVHHTAGSNSNTDYIDVVRNIYLAHTQGNGWDDIGYNYLIAQDGTIYSGRDPQDLTNEDNIQGAHFCSKNGGTMGIALLGNYDLVSPSDAMLESLKQLLSWKLFKENLNPFGNSLHPNSLGDQLGSIAIHQDGCSTACPGSNITSVIQKIKQGVNDNLEGCGLFLSATTVLRKKQIRIYPNPSQEVFHIAKTNSLKYTYSITTSLGQLVKSGVISSSNEIIRLDSGIYTIFLVDSFGNKTVQRLVSM